ncbi:transcriptional regulator family: Fungal Specific TF [Penicillium soppii]|uniref:transcriptional regulator family: Fungal Specific TF n=1 Tax=Penicillium soppii TaxID=69789 RepID=UPI0025466CDE|nr:transcriptional regulator family: Fungal Specific TF [Penicillium soppii]KAJ5860262.1 transcriptional regulator family: Fungal Specific TF [Penicillium soppii]
MVAPTASQKTFDFRRLSLEEAQSSNRSEFGAGFVNSDPATPQFFQDTFLDFFNGPFGDGQKPMDDPYNTGDLTYQTVMPQGQTTNLALPADQSVFEPERPFARALIQSILARAWQVPLDPKAQQEISANLNFILTTGRIRQFISLYFKCWQPSCAMLHVPSFDPETVPLPLLAAVAFMGAMYSSDQRETCVAKRVLDFAELFVFSSDVFSAESEVSIVFSGGRCYKDETTDWVKFQNCQAGFIILLAQYWAGSRVSRNRAMENRFSEVVKVARRMELVKARHLPDDQGHEHLWIQKECRVRTASIISLLDCAFFFYQNYPCRLTQSEMECDLPSDESVFFSEHPFAEPKFCFSRELTITAAFENLLEETELKPMDLTALDMFILIHLLYSFINAHMATLGPFIRMGNITKPGHLMSDRPQQAESIPEDRILVSVKNGLSRWRDYWFALRNRVSNDEWASMGFYKNSYNFWLVSQLLITKKDAVDVVMRMEVHCEDKLEKLKVLLDDQKDL